MMRAAEPADLESLYAFELRCFRERPFRRDHVDWILHNDHALTLVQDGTDGFVAVMMLLFEGRTCRVLSLGVAERARRRGIATRMMQAAEAVSRERGIPSVRLEVSTRNFGAIELYRRLGYRTDGVLYGYYSWGEDAYSMSKLLPRDPVPPASAEEDSSTMININQ